MGYSLVFKCKILLFILMRDAKELAKKCNEDFCSKKRNCGIVVQGGTSSLRENVDSELRGLVTVPVFTPDFQVIHGQYIFDLKHYV